MNGNLHEFDNNIIQFEVINGGKNKMGNPDKKSGQSTEVYAFKTKEEIDAMIAVLDNHIKAASDEDKRKIAYRNKMFFMIGINLGIRASDLRTLKWSFFLDKQSDGKLQFKPFYVIQPLKQRKHNKFVPLFFNDAVKGAINSYIERYSIENMDGYLFSSRKGNEPIEVSSLWKIIKDTAIEAGIKQNIGSHSLRKTFGFWRWHEAKDKTKALIILQNIFNHSSTITTMRYIGLLDEEISEMYNSINLGMEFV
jgi:integrase